MISRHVPTFTSWIQTLLDPWLWKMAWRDTRASRIRLLVFACSIVFGVAALVAIRSLGANFKLGIDEQAKALLGADLVLGSRDSFSAEMEPFLAKIPGIQAREISFSSMAFFPKSQNTRLVQVRALAGEFPFYGGLETVPENALVAFRNGSGALVEESLMTQFNLQPGDVIRLGELSIPIAGTLRKVPGESLVFATIAPRVYIAQNRLPETKLLRKESLARYRIFYKLNPNVDPAKVVRENRAGLAKFRFSYVTVEDRKKDLGRALENLVRFLNLGAFIALLLGAIGIGSALHVHIKQKLTTVAILRCLGARASQTVWIYVLQAAALGLFGAIIGGLLGVGLQYAVFQGLAGLVPVPVSVHISWGPLLEALTLGFIICLLFALIPLVGVRLVSPLNVIRSQAAAPVGRDPFKIAIFAGIAGALVWFSISQTQRWWHGVLFATGVIAAFLIIAAAGKLMMLALQRANISWLPYVWRQGLANLHRPQNRTLLLLLSLGLGTFLLLTLSLLQHSLSKDLFPAYKKNQPNAVLFDIQVDQLEAVRDVLKSEGLPVLQEVPMVTMRLTAIKGASVERLLRNPNRTIPGWALRREYRSTYRENLIDSEQSIAGSWPAPQASPEIFPISVEDGIAKDLQVGLGDQLTFDVQGVVLKTVVVNLRKVDWRRLQPSFFVVFPTAALAGAPAFHVIVTRVETSEQSGKMQREIVQKFPNISTIDLTLVLQTLDSILDKVGLVLRFMAFFTLAAGLFVLGGSVVSGRYQRIQESVLLRTLGASKRQILLILFAEYAFLGVTAALAGIALAQVSAWALSRFVFEVAYSPAIWPSLGALVLTPLATVVIGLAASASILNHSPLEVLRRES